MITAAAVPITVLLVEDSAADARLVLEMLRTAGTDDFRIEHVTRLADGLCRVAEGDVTAILLDLTLPDAEGLCTVERLRESAPHIPVVVLSNHADVPLAVEAVRAGAQDYLVKGRIDGDLLTRTLHYAIERRLAEERIEARTLALEAKRREQDAFIYTVSHDLRAPLLSLQGMAGILVKDYADELAEEARLYLQRIAANADRMHRMLNDLLELARIGRVEVEYDSVALGDVVAAVILQLEYVLHSRGASVELPAELPTVQANRTQMEQVFTNLIDNAVKYTPLDRTPIVRIEAAEKEEGWEIAVSDNGIGIPRQFEDRILGIFQRLPQGKALNPGGSGVGLAIVARIVEAHGGRLWLDSVEGAGTSVHFTLPRLLFEGA